MMIKGPQVLARSGRLIVFKVMTHRETMYLFQIYKNLQIESIAFTITTHFNFKNVGFHENYNFL